MFISFINHILKHGNEAKNDKLLEYNIDSSKKARVDLWLLKTELVSYQHYHKSKLWQA
jgi:hypothetical protein